MKSTTLHACTRWALATAAACLIATGCDYGKNDHFSHKPPAGQGSLIVNNLTGDDIAVYVDGQRLKDVGDYDDRAYDLSPGVRRVLLDQRGGHRTFDDDVDVVEGRRTVMDVESSGFDSRVYNVTVFVD